MPARNNESASPPIEDRLHLLLGAFYDGGADTNERRSELLDRYPDFAPELSRYFAQQDRFHREVGGSPSSTRLDSGEPKTCDAGGSEGDEGVAPDYEILERLSEGGMSIVYRGRRRGLDRIVAIKLLHPELATTVNRVRFENEAAAVSELDHPNIIPIFEVGRNFFAMKYMSGGSLGERIREYFESPLEAARVMVKVARAVNHAHERGILHRDLKPANVLLDESGEPYVSDFGLAKRLSSDMNLTRSGQIIGTFNYMAPEQATGGPGDVTTRTDIWGLGAILYSLLAGRTPFRAENAA